MRYVVDDIPMSILAGDNGVALFVTEIANEELCRELSRSYLFLKSEDAASYISNTCGVKAYTMGGEIEVRDADELIVVNTRKKKAYRVRVRVAPLDGKCTAGGNNIDVYYRVCRTFVEGNGIFEALVLDL